MELLKLDPNVFDATMKDHIESSLLWRRNFLVVEVDARLFCSNDLKEEKQKFADKCN